jgi:hypothetical protein
MTNNGTHKGQTTMKTTYHNTDILSRIMIRLEGPNGAEWSISGGRGEGQFGSYCADIDSDGYEVAIRCNGEMLRLTAWDEVTYLGTAQITHICAMIAMGATPEAVCVFSGFEPNGGE